MNLKPFKEKSIWALITAGILIAILSALESHWEWLAAMCGRFSSGCIEVREFTLFTYPIAYWGIAFYLFIAVINITAKQARFWVVTGAMGIELTFLWIIYSMQMPCLFCLLNAVVVFCLFILVFNQKLWWQAIAVCSISFIVSNFVLTKENRQIVAASKPQTALTQDQKSRKPKPSSKPDNGTGTQTVDLEKAIDDRIIEFNIEKSPTFGPQNATVVMVEFSDYMCPACRRFHQNVSELKTLFQDRVKWVFKDFPLRQHKGAERLAEAARCAWEQNKFWEFQDELFTLPQPVDFNIIPTLAEALGLEMSQFLECVDTRKYMFEVIQDKQEALESGINSTPSVFINGRKLIDVKSKDELKQIITAVLENQPNR